MKLYLKTVSSSGEDDADIACAYVDLTPELAKCVVTRMATFKALHAKDDSLLKIAYWDSDCLYLQNEFDGVEDILEEIDDKDHVEADQHWTVGARTELDQMLIYEDRVMWTCSPKHSDIYITTASVPLDLCERIAKGAHGRIVKAMKKRKRRKR